MLVRKSQVNDKTKMTGPQMSQPQQDGHHNSISFALLGAHLQMSPVRSTSGSPTPDVVEQDHHRNPHLLHQEQLHGARREEEPRGPGGHDGEEKLLRGEITEDYNTTRL